MKKKFIWLGVFLFVFVLFGQGVVKAADYTFENITKRTTSATYKNTAQFQVVGSKIYYVWQEGLPYNQIWTAEMNTDGTGFTATQRTSSSYNKINPQLQVVGNKIYYVWQERDFNFKVQLWTAEMNTDGTGFTATKRTTAASNMVQSPQLEVVGTKIYYVWQQSDGSYVQIWTAEMNTDGTGFAATKRTTSPYDKWGPQMQVEGTKIYFVWDEDDTYRQIWTAVMNTDGSGFTATKRTNSSGDKTSSQLDIDGTNIHYVWLHNDSGLQITTGSMNLDGTGFSSTKQTDSTFVKSSVQFQVSGSSLFYTWHETDGSDYQIWTAEMKCGLFSASKRTNSAFDKTNPQLMVDGTNIYYVWDEKDVISRDQIWTADGTGTIFSGSGKSFENPEGNLKSISDEIIDSSPGNTSNHKITFSLENDLTLGASIVLYFNDYDLGGVSLGVEDFDVKIGVTEQTLVSGSEPGSNEIELDMSSELCGVVILDLGSSVDLAADDQIEIEIGTNATSGGSGDTQIVNPSSVDSYGIDIGTFNSDDGSGDVTDYGNTQVPIVDNIVVSASVPTTLTFTSTPVTSGTPCPNSGGNADFGTTGNSVNFGNYTGGEDRLGCQEISVTTNATDGYVTTMQIDQALTNSTSDVMDSFAGSSGSANTWTIPEVWTSPVVPNDSYFGWTTDDTTDYSKFASNKYAAFVANETPYEVATEDGPVVAETNYITFRLEVGNNQEAGIYTGSVMYITTATY